MLTAFTMNGAAMPNAAASTPPNAGPTARLTLTPTLFIAIAGGRSSRGTRSGTTDCQGGAVAAEPDSMRKVSTSKDTGEIRSRQTR